MSIQDIAVKAAQLAEEQLEDELHFEHRDEEWAQKGLFKKNLFELAELYGFDLEQVKAWVD